MAQLAAVVADELRRTGDYYLLALSKLEDAAGALVALGVAM